MNKLGIRNWEVSPGEYVDLIVSYVDVILSGLYSIVIESDSILFAFEYQYWY